jgi:hypothetical protein
VTWVEPVEAPDEAPGPPLALDAPEELEELVEPELAAPGGEGGGGPTMVTGWVTLVVFPATSTIFSVTL